MVILCRALDPHPTARPPGPLTPPGVVLFNVLADVNWLAVAIATVAATVLAGLYFALLVPKYYVIALGRQNAPAPAPSPVSNFGPAVCILVTTITSAILVEALDITSTSDALTFGAIVGVGYLTAMTFQIAINPNFPRPLYYGLLNAPFFIASSLLTSAILVALR
jgi:hypothetical protein